MKRIRVAVVLLTVSGFIFWCIVILCLRTPQTARYYSKLVDEWQPNVDAAMKESGDLSALTVTVVTDPTTPTHLKREMIAHSRAATARFSQALEKQKELLAKSKAATREAHQLAWRWAFVGISCFCLAAIIHFWSRIRWPVHVQINFTDRQDPKS